MRLILSVILLVGSFLTVSAQFVVAPGTSGVIQSSNGPVVFAFNFDAAGDIKIDPSQFDFSKASFILTGNSSPNISIVGSSNNPLSISLSALSLNNATISSGTVQVTDNLTLQGGILTVPSTSKLVYSGNAISGASPTSYISGKLFMKGTGSRTFPIGNAAFGYLPVTLLDVKDADTEIGFEAIAGDPGITAALPSDIQSIFTDYYWTITNGNSGSYSGGSPIQLSLNGAGNSFTDGDPVILEVGTGGTLTELGGIVANPDITSAQVTTATAQKYVLGKSEKVTVNIHRVITPNGDGQNDYLYIDGIDFYTNNTVKLVDRWGVVHFEKSNFKNYGQANPSDFDFSKLSNGNYICVVDLANGPKINPKMISVVK